MCAGELDVDGRFLGQDVLGQQWCRVVRWSCSLGWVGATGPGAA